MQRNSILMGWKYLITFIVGGIIGFCISYFFFPKVNVEKEYITVTDTITVTQDRIVEKTKLKYITDTIIKVDTFVIEKDGVLVTLPIEHKEYLDTLTFKDSISAYVDLEYSGYKPSIDRFDLDIVGARQVTTIKEPKKFGITWTVGPYIGFGFNGTMTNPVVVGWGPTIGICASIGFGGMIL